MLLQCHGPVFTSWLMKSLCMSAHLVMLRTGSASAPRSTRADCASSTLVSETPAVMEPHASQSRNWRLYVSAPMEGKVCCVTNVSVTALHRSMQCRLNSLIKRLICKHFVNESLEQFVNESHLLGKRINERKWCWNGKECLLMKHSDNQDKTHGCPLTERGSF